jgi:hypothetical protein
MKVPISSAKTIIRTTRPFASGRPLISTIHPGQSKASPDPVAFAARDLPVVEILNSSGSGQSAGSTPADCGRGPQNSFSF